jgi:CheY-like chemotaxis protein
MDMFMPIMDGIEAAKKIRALDPEIPIVAMTANVMVSDLAYYKKHGMTDCLGKPFTSQELWRTLLGYLTPINNKNDDAKSKESDMSDDEILRMKLREGFTKSNRNKYIEIEKTLKAGDIKEAHRLAHNLKGNAGLIGKPILQKAAAEVEAILRRGETNIPEEAKKRLKAELAKVVKELDSLQSPPAPVTELKQLTAEETAELYEKLESLLEKRSLECLELLEGLRAIKGAEQLAQEVEECDFKRALITLKELKGTVLLS